MYPKIESFILAVSLKGRGQVKKHVLGSLPRETGSVKE